MLLAPANGTPLEPNSAKCDSFDRTETPVVDFVELANRYPNIVNPRVSTGDAIATESSRKAATKAAFERCHELKRELGCRYADLTLPGFIVSTEDACRRKQERVLDQLTAYRDSLKKSVTDGSGVFLFGPAGCGKDHLLSALMLDAVRAGYSVKWLNGMDIYGEFRDVMDSDTTEREMVVGMARPDILALSDPIPPSGCVTDFQRSQLFRVIDRRYRNRKPTWLTANVSSREEADQRFGVQLVDRLTHGALCLPFNWPSFRASRWGGCDQKSVAASPPERSPASTGADDELMAMVDAGAML